MGEFYKINEIDNMQFYMVPKTLYTSENYRGLSDGAKMAYSILLDRMQLSKKNGWADEQGNIYIIFPREELASIMGVSKRTAINYMKELGEYDLVIEKKQGLTRPNLIFVLKPHSRDEEFFTLRSEKNSIQEVKKNIPNNTDNINTDFIKNNNKDTSTVQGTPKAENVITLNQKFQNIAKRSNWTLILNLMRKYSYDYILEKLQYMEKFAKKHVIRNFEGFLVAALRDNYIIIAEQIAKRAQRIISSTYQKLEEYRNIKPAKKEVALGWLAQMRAQLV